MVEFIKKYYWILIIVLALSYHVIKINNMNKIIKTTVTSYDNQIFVLKKNWQEENNKQQQLLEQHKIKIEQLEKDYTHKLIELQQERKKKVQIIVKYYDDPEKLINKIKELYGFQYVPYKKNNINNP